VLKVVVIKEVVGKTYPTFVLVVNGNEVAEDFDTEFDALVHYVTVVIEDALVFNVKGEQQK